jgi:hypothetical protein
MTTFKEFVNRFENMWGEIPGNPCFGGKKPSDGNGVNPYNVNRPGGSGGGAAQAAPPAGAKMMKKKMKKG